MKTNNLKCEKELDQNKRKNKNEIENLKELNTKLEEKLKACARDNDLLSSDLGRTSDRLRYKPRNWLFTPCNSRKICLPIEMSLSFRILQEEFEENLSKNSNNLSETIKNFSVENSNCTNRADERKRNRFQLWMFERKIFEFGQLKPI